MAKGAIPITALQDKFIGYCAVTPNKKFMKLFERANVQNILISYHYIRKDKTYTKDILQMIRDRGGLFMTDSGIFSFVHDKGFDHKTFDWMAYLEEYTEWLDQNKEYIFSACNLDADMFVTPDTIRGWNKDYFEKLNRDINVIFVAHKNARGRGELDAFKEYADQYSYVAVNESMKHMASQIYQYAKKKNVAIHGLAWTKPTILNDFPFFSVDSSTWVNYQKFGATPHWDGQNFNQYDKDNKAIRKTMKKQCDLYGVKFYEFQFEKDEKTGKHNDDEGLTFSLRTWLDVFQNLKNKARTKLSIKLEDLLDGKVTKFAQSPLAQQNQQTITTTMSKPEIELDEDGQPKKKKSKLSEMLDGKDNIGEEVDRKITYQEGEGGELVPIYDKREKVDITVAKAEEFGDSLFCDNCHVADKCPKKKAGASCAFNFAPAVATESPMAMIDFLIKIQTERVNRAMFMENMEGGLVNKTFTQELRVLQELNNTKVNMMVLAQSKGVKVTQITITEGGVPQLPDGTGNGGQQQQAAGGGGFAAMLTNLMKG